MDQRKQLVMQNAMARHEGRLARMGEPSPMMMGMVNQGMQQQGQDGGMNPMMAGLMGGPGAFTAALQGNAHIAGQRMQGSNLLEAQKLRNQGDLASANAHNQGMMDVAKIQFANKNPAEMASQLAQNPILARQMGIDPMQIRTDSIRQKAQGGMLDTEVSDWIKQYFDSDAWDDSNLPFRSSPVLSRENIGETFTRKAAADLGIPPAVAQQWWDQFAPNSMGNSQIPFLWTKGFAFD
jgi:hypothetical protein